MLFDPESEIGCDSKNFCDIRKLIYLSLEYTAAMQNKISLSKQNDTLPGFT